MNNTAIKVSKKQLEANKKNALKGGVKTTEGKETIKYNAVKHGLSSNTYDEEFEKEILEEYKVEGTLQKILVKNICISKARYEKGVDLESKLIGNITTPPKYKKVYDSKEEYEQYLRDVINDPLQLTPLSPIEPSYSNKLVNGREFSYDMDKIKYLIEVIGKYNNQNEARFTKNITNLLQVIKL